MSDSTSPRGASSILTVLNGIDVADVRALPYSAIHAAGVDVGGTRFRAGMVDHNRTPVRQVEWKTRELASVTDGLVRFLLGCGLRPARLCLGITGAQTADGTVHQPNVPSWWPDFNWIDASRALGIEVFAMNDMGVAALAMQRLNAQPDFNRTIVPGAPVAGGKILMVGLGTGLGDAYLDGNYVGQGEAGHHPFSPRDQIEDRILAFARDELRDDIVSFEDLLSGSKGVQRLYRFYSANVDLAEEELAALLPGMELPPAMSPWPGTGPERGSHKDSAEAITRFGAEPGSVDFDPVSFVTLKRLGDVFGTYLGARAVTVTATGGIKIFGGVLSLEVLKLWVRYSEFKYRIRNMGIHRSMAARFQVDWVTHPYPGLVGAVEAALGAARPS